MDITFDIILECIKHTNHLTEEEQIFLIANLKNINVYFLKKFNKEFSITI